jgi:hypothetical protein
VIVLAVVQRPAVAAVPALPLTFPVTFPVKAAEMVPALKLPEPSRLTICEAVLAFVAAFADVTAEFIALCVLVTAPVTFGKVAFTVDLSKRI